MADVPEHFSDTAQEKSEANDVQIVATQKKKKKKKRKYYISSSSESSSGDTDSEPVNKRRKKVKKRNLKTTTRYRNNKSKKRSGIMTKYRDLSISTRHDLAYGMFLLQNITTEKQRQKQRQKLKQVIFSMFVFRRKKILTLATTEEYP